MLKNNYIPFIFGMLILLYGCGLNAPQPKALVGSYFLTIKIDEEKNLQTEEMLEGLNDFISSGLKLSESVIKNLNIDLELMEDGNVRSSNMLVNMGLTNIKWEVSKNRFYFYNEKDKEKGSGLPIAKMNKNGFHLTTDGAVLNFEKTKK
jgi:hypothetical protein